MECDLNLSLPNLLKFNYEFKFNNIYSKNMSSVQFIKFSKNIQGSLKNWKFDLFSLSIYLIS